MKKIILGFAVGLLIAFPASTIAANYELPWTKNIYNISDQDKGKHSGSVSVFDDGDNKCYVARATGGSSQGGPDSISISCVREQ